MQGSRANLLLVLSSRVRPLVCLLLVACFLYNPFISLIHSSHGLSAHHLTRNRSTVGAGELQNFSPESKAAALNVLSAKCIRETLIAPPVVEFLAVVFAPVRPIFVEFTSNLFFRPPPSA
jgi:hypothetical protein